MGMKRVVEGDLPPPAHIETRVGSKHGLRPPPPPDDDGIVHINEPEPTLPRVFIKDPPKPWVPHVPRKHYHPLDEEQLSSHCVKLYKEACYFYDRYVIWRRNAVTLALCLPVAFWIGLML